MSAPGINPEEILAWAAARHAPRIAFGTGFGVEGCALVHMIATQRLPIDVFTLDTGLLFPETYALWKALEARYRITIRAVPPEQTVEEQALAHGERLWERDPDRCCRLRKVAPLQRALTGYEAWISAIRRDQTRERATSLAVEQDPLTGAVKVNPLIAWSAAEVWDYVHKHAVPFNPLHERGYPSIGCQPCTTPVAAGEDPRAGRWRGMARSECGLHGRKEVQQMTAQETLVTPHGGSAASEPAARPPGFILWFTGLSGAGKSTLAEAVRKQIANIPVEILDGDEVRQYLSLGLGFSKNDRDTNVRRIGYVARLLARNGVGVITAAISPYRETRAEVRRLALDAGIPFIEVHVSAELDTLVARDVKGLYKKALAGEIQHFTGVSDPYEAPEHPELVVRTDGEPVTHSVGQILTALQGRGLISAVRERSA